MKKFFFSCSIRFLLNLFMVFILVMFTNDLNPYIYTFFKCIILYNLIVLLFSCKFIENDYEAFIKNNINDIKEEFNQAYNFQNKYSLF